MVDEPDSFTLRFMRRIDEKLDRLIEDNREIKSRLDILEQQVGSLTQQYASLSVRIDRMEFRLDRIEKRLDLVEV